MQGQQWRQKSEGTVSSCLIVIWPNFLTSGVLHAGEATVACTTIGDDEEDGC